MQAETLNPYYDPKKSSVANLKAWRIALESKAGAVHRGKKVARRVECTEAGGELITVGQQFEKSEHVAVALGVLTHSINQAASGARRSIRSKIDGQVYGFKYV